MCLRGPQISGHVCANVERAKPNAKGKLDRTGYTGARTVRGKIELRISPCAETRELRPTAIAWVSLPLTDLCTQIPPSSLSVRHVCPCDRCPAISFEIWP